MPTHDPEIQAQSILDQLYKYQDEDVRIAIQLILHAENHTLLLELEAIILRATEPPYNVQIPAER
jgi:hypothetical protein